MTDAILKLIGDDHDLQKMFDRVSRQSKKLVKDFEKTGDLSKLVEGSSALGVKIGRGFEAATRKQREFANQTRHTATEMGGMARQVSFADAALLRMGSRFISAAAAGELARRSFLGFAKTDEQLRKIQVQAGSSFDAVEKHMPLFRKLAVELGRPLNDIITGFDTIREEADLSLDAAAEHIEDIAKGAKAASVSEKEMAQNVGALIRNFKLARNEVPLAIDMMVKGSQDLRLNLNELVQGMPELTNAAEQWGFKGTEGLSKLLARVSAIRDGTGSTREGVQGLTRILTTLGANEKVQMAAEVSSQDSYIRRVKERVARGEDVIDIAVEDIRRAQQRGFQIETLGLREAKIWRALIKDRENARHKTEQLRQSQGATNQAIEDLGKGPQDAVNKITAAFGDTGDALGKLLTALASIAKLDQGLGTVAKYMRDITDAINGLDIRKLLWLTSPAGQAASAISNAFRPRTPLQQHRMMRRGLGILRGGAATGSNTSIIETPGGAGMVYPRGGRRGGVTQEPARPSEAPQGSGPTFDERFRGEETPGQQGSLGGGTRADRNNNPGNIKFGPFAQRMGATHADEAGFAVFPDRETGFKASEALLNTPAYANRSLGQIGQRWANGDPRWAQNVSKSTGIPVNAVPTAEQRRQIARTGIPRAEGTRIPSGGQPNIAPGQGGPPADLLARARQVASTGGPGAVQQFMRANGYPMSGAWCGQFAAAVMRSNGIEPPRNPEVASNWRNFGTPVEGDPQPGDVAVAKPGWSRRGSGRTGDVGSHVTFVESYDPKTGTFRGFGGNQGGRLPNSKSFPARRFDYRRPPAAPGMQATPSAPTGPMQGSGVPYHDQMMQMREWRSQMEQPIRMKFERDPGESQFRRAGINREVDRALRQARWTSAIDIGAA